MFNAISPKKDINIAKRQSLLEKLSGFMIQSSKAKRSSAELISIFVRLLIRGTLFKSRENIITIPFLKLFSVKVIFSKVNWLYNGSRKKSKEEFYYIYNFFYYDYNNYIEY